MACLRVSGGQGGKAEGTGGKWGVAGSLRGQRVVEIVERNVAGAVGGLGWQTPGHLVVPGVADSVQKSGPVRSFAFFGQDQDQDRLHNILKGKRPDQD